MSLLFVEVDELDVAAVLLDEGADARLDDLLDHGYAFGVVVVDLGVFGRQFLGEERLILGVVVCDGFQDLGLDHSPVQLLSLGHRDVVLPKKYSRDSVNLEKSPGERRNVGEADGGEIHGLLIGHHLLSRVEL